MNSDSKVLVSKDAKGKIRVVEISYDGDPDSRVYTIYRYTGQYQGKMTKQPEIEVTRGKASRNIHEQVELEFNSHVKKYCDKGYIILDKEIDDYTLDELNEIFGDTPTGSNGVVKPMLAKQADKVTNTKIFDKKWYASRKIDGLRCLIYMDDNGELHTSSRGAINYDGAMWEILHNEKLINCFKNHPGLIMDGEAYHHGYTLQQLNSVARTVKDVKDMATLQFYWYDIVDMTKPFVNRLENMVVIAKELGLGWDPDREFKTGELRVQFVPQSIVTGWDNMMNLHNQFVSEGWEGLVIRDPERPYKPNGRTNDMIKIKKYQSEEFLIVGYELGLRGSEDMVFILETSDGIKFKAKPHGDREQKQWYVDNFEQECLNKYAITKFFYLSDDRVPLQPSVAAIRLAEDMPF